jgi:hypothetical protein
VVNIVFIQNDDFIMIFKQDIPFVYPNHECIIKERSKFNFQRRNKTRLCDSKIRTQELRTKTQDVQNKCENISLLC